MTGKRFLKASEAGRFDPTIGHHCPHGGCKAAILHGHDDRGRIIRDSIDWEYLDSLSDPEMKQAVGGDPLAFLNAFLPTETSR